MNFSRGDVCPIQFRPLGGNVATLNVRRHNVELSHLLYDCTNSGTGGSTARLAMKADASGNVEADFDLDAPPYGPPSIIDGIGGVIAFYLSPTKALQLPVSIEKVRYETSTETAVKYSFDVKMNVLMGLVVYPAL